jgi:hypothetical protein
MLRVASAGALLLGAGALPAVQRLSSQTARRLAPAEAALQKRARLPPSASSHALQRFVLGSVQWTKHRLEKQLNGAVAIDQSCRSPPAAKVLPRPPLGGVWWASSLRRGGQGPHDHGLK